MHDLYGDLALEFNFLPGGAWLFNIIGSATHVREMILRLFCRLPR